VNILYNFSKLNIGDGKLTKNGNLLSRASLMFSGAVLRSPGRICTGGGKSGNGHSILKRRGVLKLFWGKE
jgi:hypothetical protein